MGVQGLIRGLPVTKTPWDFQCRTHLRWGWGPLQHKAPGKLRPLLSHLSPSLDHRLSSRIQALLRFHSSSHGASKPWLSRISLFCITWVPVFAQRSEITIQGYVTALGPRNRSDQFSSQIDTFGEYCLPQWLKTVFWVKYSLFLIERILPNRKRKKKDT